MSDSSVAKIDKQHRQTLLKMAEEVVRIYNDDLLDRHTVITCDDGLRVKVL
ncbi:hypothetical protein OZX73_02945 [Bifidobacterium sp. ESL0775]|uniref:hypothetical protein n=1 Tax=Bifidobacterium sp. ESL0775 TaxID=2983230 RepID=UPI0023F63D9E|nr:hypothetical protein [Bifidobacterium sp. ESL0775]WEV69839.1 hypothetical protein OZX73_02945 [Bifidobacterium sp. ESL0775]